MRYQRDVILKDLRENVIEITYMTEKGLDKIRCTLDPQFLPPAYQTLQYEERRFHSEHVEGLLVYDMQRHTWKKFLIDSVEYCQVLDAY